MKISGVKVHVLRPATLTSAPHEKFGSYFDFYRGESLVQLTTDSGIDGFCLTDSVVAEELFRRFQHDQTFVINEEKIEGLIGADPLDREKIGKLWSSRFFQFPWNNYVSSALDYCLWDIAGKAAKVPVRKLLGSYRDKILAYASSQHYDDQKHYVNMALDCQKAGFKAFKIHPSLNWKRDIGICRAIREAVGEKMVLMLDPIGMYTRDEAIVVGREIERLGFYWYEDPLPSTDFDGLSDLCRALDVKVLMGEFVKDPQGYTEYIRRGAADALRCWDINVGGISSMMKIAHLAELFGMKCEIVSWGNKTTQAAALNAMLSINNMDFFEVSVPESVFKRGFKNEITVDGDGFVHSLDGPGLGLDVDWDEIERTTLKTLTYP